MDLKVVFTVFCTVLVAELGDKTQLATLFFASDRDTHTISVFLGSALALIVTSALAVILGNWLSQHLYPRLMSIIAGAGFVLIGGLMLYKGISVG